MVGTTNYPYNFSNTRGVPMVSSTGVNVTDTNVVITIPKKAFRGLASSGLVALKTIQEIPSAGASLPVVLDSNGFTQAITNAGSTPTTGDSMTPVGVYLLWYDKYNSSIQLLTTA